MSSTSIRDVKHVIEQDRRYTVRDICDITSMGRGTVHHIETEQLNMRDHGSQRKESSCIQEVPGTIPLGMRGIP